MDGTAPASPRARLRARTGALAALAMLLLWLAPGAGAQAPAGGPGARWPGDGAAVRAAEAIAATHWGVRPCDGEVGVLWENLGGGVNARASWSNLESQWDAPAGNTGCEVSLNAAATWDWPKLCTVLVHELGHLAGHDHVDDADDVMYPEYVAPLPACEAAPEPAAATPLALRLPTQRPAPSPRAKTAPKRAKPVPRRTAKPARRTSPKR